MPYLRDPSRANALIFMILCNLMCNLQYIRDGLPTARVLRAKTIFCFKHLAHTKWLKSIPCRNLRIVSRIKKT